VELRTSEIAAATGGRLVGPDHGVCGATIDSRLVVGGELFVPVVAERDGHDFVPAALAAGAAAYLTSHAALPDARAPAVEVGDTGAALTALGRHARDRLAEAAGDRVVGITGSVGKTSTKDLLAQVLERAGPTVAAVGNLNNELGVPLTVGLVDEQTRYLVAEMGARGIGHIAYLCDIAPPRVGVVLNVGQAHVGEFGGQAAIARAKGELVEALPPDGWAVLNIDDPLVWSMRRRTLAQLLPWSTIQPLEDGVWASGLAGDAYGRYSFELHNGRDSQSESQVQLQLTGRHQVANAVAAAAAAVAVGLELDQVATALAAAGPRSRWRMELHDRSDGVTVINDAYNANPESMRAALTTLAELGRAGRHTWAVLGDMLELGETAAEEHAAIGRFAAQSGVEHLVAIGEYATQITSAAVAAGLPSTRAVPAADKAAAVAVVTSDLGPGDVVLVKASRGLALDTVADEILAAVGPPSHQDAV
jgi:UDP-N-acetylmuramoyl-tripeptide--D-alanyl-D-alanine ligase